jgi:hypothetical protein
VAEDEAKHFSLLITLLSQRGIAFGDHATVRLSSQLSIPFLLVSDPSSIFLQKHAGLCSFLPSLNFFLLLSSYPLTVLRFHLLLLRDVRSRNVSQPSSPSSRSFLFSLVLLLRGSLQLGRLVLRLADHPHGTRGTRARRQPDND